jgi:GDP-L-fucose synthase
MSDFLITGGTGMVGSALRTILPDALCIDRESLHNSSYNVEQKVVVHLAARVGGVKANTDYVGDFYFENSIINQKVLEKARVGKAKKVVSMLSTCVYPDAQYVTYPLTEDQLHMGPPHDSNFGYAYSKRMLDVMSRAYRHQYGCDFITVIPNNLYGFNDNFDLNSGHVIPSLIRKVFEAKISRQPFVEVWGDGSPLREFTFSMDVAKILLFVTEKYSGADPVNIGNSEEHTIKQVIEEICRYMEYSGSIHWKTNFPNGQARKPSSNKKLIDLGWKENDFTPLKEGLRLTCKWFVENYPNLRGIS